MKRHYRHKRRRRRFAYGRKARGICDRGGHEVAYHDMVIEPGTGLRVDKRWSDGRWNKVHHPQNFSADTAEAVGLRYARLDREEPYASNTILIENEPLMDDATEQQVIDGGS